MKTVKEIIEDRTKEIEDKLKCLILEHSELYLRDKPGDGFFCSGGNHGWRELSTEGKNIQSNLNKTFKMYYQTISVLLDNEVEKIKRQLDEPIKYINKTIEQTSTWEDALQSTIDKSLENLHKIQNLINCLYSSNNGFLFVPDTNALLFNPDLETWDFDGVKSFTIVLTPTILSELDKKKTDSNEKVKVKAEKIIRKIKEYRRRGTLSDGVPVVKGKINMKSLAVEPDMGKSLPWLKESNADDRFIATFIEVMRECPDSVIQLVTRDINLQNKLEFARLPFVEPPNALTKKQGKG